MEGTKRWGKQGRGRRNKGYKKDPNYTESKMKDKGLGKGMGGKESGHIRLRGNEVYVKVIGVTLFTPKIVR